MRETTDKQKSQTGQEATNKGRRNSANTLDVLYEISQAVSTTRDLDELYRMIHLALNNILSVDNFYIALYHPDRDSITFPFHVDEKDENPGEIVNFSRTASLTGRVITSRRPMIFSEHDILDFAEAQNQNVIGSLSRVWLGAPLMIRERVMGAIAIHSYDPENDFREKDLDLLSTLSQHIALALERKETENRLKEQQILLETILESSPVGICLVENRVFKWVNSQMVALLGYGSKSDLTDQDAAVIYPDQAAYVKAGQIIQHQLHLTGRADFDMELKRADNTCFKAHLIITGSEQDRVMNRTIAIVADISELERIHQEKMEREKLQGVLEMAGAVCHEINQPLQTIFGYLELFDDPSKISAPTLNQIKVQAGRIADITRQLARITRYKTRPYPGDKTIMDIWGSSD